MQTATATKERVPAPSPREVEETVNRILAQTDWNEYEQKVSAGVAREVEALDAARARSFAASSRKFLR